MVASIDQPKQKQAQEKRQIFEIKCKQKLYVLQIIIMFFWFFRKNSNALYSSINGKSFGYIKILFFHGGLAR
jgi:hypothetical protein